MEWPDIPPTTVIRIIQQGMYSANDSTHTVTDKCIPQILPYSGKLSREKTFVNFAVFWLSAKVFSTKLGGMVSFGTAKVSNPRKFSLYFHQFAKVFSRESFPLYGITARAQWRGRVHYRHVPPTFQYETSHSSDTVSDKYKYLHHSSHTVHGRQSDGEHTFPPPHPLTNNS